MKKDRQTLRHLRRKSNGNFWCCKGSVVKKKSRPNGRSSLPVTTVFVVSACLAFWAGISVKSDSMSLPIISRELFSLSFLAAVNQARPEVLIDGTPLSLDLVNLQGQPLTTPSSSSSHDQSRATALAAALPLPKPIILVGLPKVGVEALGTFFRKSGYSINFDSRVGARKNGGSKNDNNNQRQYNEAGKCVQNAIETKKSKTPLQDCGNYDVWTQLDTMERESSCMLPQLTHLEALHQEYPNATFVLNLVDDLERWAGKVQSWKSLRLAALSERLAQCPTLGLRSSSTPDLVAWHEEHIRNVRKFVQQHPSHALLEVNGDDPATAERLAKAFHGRVQDYPRRIVAMPVKEKLQQLRKNALHTGEAIQQK